MVGNNQNEKVTAYRNMLQSIVEQNFPGSSQNNRVLEFKKLIEGLAASNYEVMLFHQGLGETCVFAMLAGAYKEKTKRPLVILTLSNSRAEILRQCPHIDSVMNCDEEIFYTIAADMEFRERLQIKNYWELHYLYEGANMREKVYRYLELPSHIPYTRYPLKSGEFPALRQLFDELGLQEGKTVFLIPSAIYYGDEVVSPSFWKKLVKGLREAGYRAVFNAPEEVVEGVPHVYLSMENVPDFARLCGNVVGVRTGLLDVIGIFSDVRIQAIYPNEFCPVWEKNAGILEESGTEDRKAAAQFHLREKTVSDLADRNNIFEFIHGEEEEDVQRIVGQLEGHPL